MNSNFLPPQNEPYNYQGQPRRSTDLSGNGHASQQPGSPPYQMPPMGNSPAPLPPQQGYNPPFIGRPVQAVRRWSNKMAAMHRPTSPAEPHPLVRYRAQQPVVPNGRPIRPEPARPEPWQRSRAQKVTRMIRKRRERSQENAPNGKRIASIISGVIAALLLISLAIGGYSAYAYYENQIPQLQSLANLQTEQSTRFYDRNGKLIYTLYDTRVGRSIPITYAEIPGYLQDAQIAAEDKTFWQNDGIDLQAILRSAFIDANAGAAQTGASTLTQQVIKNLIDNEPQNRAHPPDRNTQEKLTEAALAIGLTQQYSKAKIMEMYFNISSYGAQEQGVEAAAEDFFGLKPKCTNQFQCTPAIDFLNRDNSAGKCKSANDDSTCPLDPVLGLARASLLASIPQNPVIYDPTVHPEFYKLLLSRQDYTLQQMKGAQMSINLGLGSQKDLADVNGQPITIDDSIISQAEALSKNFNFIGFQGYNEAPQFIQWVIQTLSNQLGHGQGIDPNTHISVPGYNLLLTGGFNIQTTLDSNLQTYVENAVKRHVTQPEYQPFLYRTETLSKNDNLHDSAVVVMDAKTGEVLAMDGSVNYKDKSLAGAGQINMALQPRAPGSAFKPFVIAEAYEIGWYPGIVLPDIKTYFPEPSTVQSQAAGPANSYYTTDYGGGFHNIKSNIELAISNSFNVPALKAEYYDGLKNVYNMAARLGITSINPNDPNEMVDSMALGTVPVSLLQMVDAYQTFANQGVRIPQQGILGIWDNYGHQLYQYNPGTAGTRVLSKQISFLVTKTLDNEADREQIEFQGDNVLSMWDWTLPDGAHPDVATKTGTTDSFKDNWTIGYTPDVVVGVWSGNANDAAMVNSIGVTGAAPIWHSIIEYVSGKCNTSTDQIPCPKLDLHYTDRQFTMPDGIVQQEVNTTNGLAGTGYLTYMIDGEQPAQTGRGKTCTDPTCNGNN